VSYQVLARKYRPQTFDEVVGQEHVVRTLSNAIATGRIAHAFLFVGPRGIGKTSIARILAKALNCTNGPKADFDINDDICREIAEGRSLDVLEIDGASNNGVEQVRDLRDNVQYAPAKGKFKVYIIDEVHMLSVAAFNALLKTLEEPPAHVKFIFATTEVHKLPATILSRCQRFDLKRISDDAIAKHLKKICQLEGITISDDALVILARNAEGGMRDAESALDQLISFCGKTIEEKDALEVFGLTGVREIWDLAEAIQAGQSDLVIRQVRLLVAKGKDLTQLTRELTRYFRNLLIFVISPEIAKAELTATEVHHYENLQPLPSREAIMAFIEELQRLEERIRYALVKEVLFEITMLRLAQQLEKVSLEQIIRKLASGEPAQLVSVKTGAEAKPVAVAAPVVEKPVPAPIAAPVPIPVPAPVPVVVTPAAVDSAAIWSAIVAEFGKQRPLLQGAMSSFSFRAASGGKLQVTLKTDRTTRENLLTAKNQDLLQELAKKKLGPLGVVEVIFEEQAPPPVAPEPAFEPSSAKAAPKKEAAKAPVAAGPIPGKEEFLNDPLIKKAMEEFDARLVEVKG
jgi:DNA polymerase-3 subunit gamma/tau